MIRRFFLIILFCWAPMMYSQSDAHIWSKSVVGENNFYISLPIFVSTDSVIALAQFVIEYDSSVIVPLSTVGQTGSGIPGFSIVNSNTNLPFPPNAAGANKNLLIQISGGGSGSFTGDSLEVLLVDFLVIGAYKSECRIHFDQTEGHTFLSTESLNDIQGESINFIAGHVEVDDFTPPAEFDLRSPPDSSWTTAGLPVFSWDSSTDASSGLAYYQLFINSQLNLNNISPEQTSSTPALELNDGEYFWKVVVNDSAENARASKSLWMLRIDRTAPISEITNLDSGQQVSGTYIITGTANDGSGSGVDSVLISFDDAVTWHSATKTSDDFSTWQYIWNITRDGPIKILSRSIDKLGNEEIPHEITVTEVQEKAGFIPKEFALTQNYPNPFNPETHIEYQVPARTQVTIKIFNLMGQEIATLVDRVREAGNHKVNWNGNDSSGKKVASGIYLYLMRAGEFVASRKLIVLR